MALLEVERLSKIYCRDLRLGARHGLRDMAIELGRQQRTLSLRPGEFLALDNVSLRVERGQCLGLIGPNGAGKSTLLKILTGLIKPTRGTVRLDGRVAGLIELGTGFNVALSARANVFLNAALHGLSTGETRRRFADIVP